MNIRLIHNTKLGDDALAELAEYFDLTTEYRNVTPKTKLNPYFNQVWMDFDWMRSLFTETLDVRAFATTSAELKRLDIRGHLGMYDLVDNDGVIDFYFGLPTKLDKRAKASGFKHNLAWLFMHEYLHGKEQLAGYKDRVHAMDDQGRLKELFNEHIERDKLVAKVGMLQKLIALLTQLLSGNKPQTLQHPVEDFAQKISQPYGVLNKKYPATGRHIGVDYVCPKGTPVLAPWDGDVIASGYTDAKGYFCHYRYLYNGGEFTGRFMHLKYAPQQGTYKRGSLIGHTSNTGQTTGYHLHHDIWVGDVRLDLINKSNWAALTVDPQKHYV